MRSLDLIIPAVWDWTVFSCSLFIEIWDALSAAERRLLCAVAETGDTAPFATEFLQKYHLGAASSVQRIVERLTQKGIVDRTNNRYRITDPIFARWITREDLPELE